MIVRGQDGRRQAAFALFDTSTPVPRPSEWGATLSHAGERITFEAAVGLPAFLRGVRLISETAAGLPFCVYRGSGENKRPVPEAAQHALFERPNPDQTAFSVWSYTFAAMLRGNAYLYKIKTGNTVKALYPVNPSHVTPRYDGATPTFEIRDREYGPVVETVTKSEIIHVPGILLTDPYVGVSVVAAERHSIGTELGRQRFEGKYLANDGTPGVILKHPGLPTPEQRREVRQSYEARHVGNAGRVGMVWGGWDLDRLPLSLQDAQFIEAKRYSVQDVGRMLGIPSGLLNDPDAPGGDSPEHENMRLLQHGIAPWMERLEDALESDADLFPSPDWCGEMDTQGFLRADIQTRWNAYRLGRQGGWITANEIRALEGKPPVDGGDQIQETPVGGAVNNESTAGSGGADANAA